MKLYLAALESYDLVPVIEKNIAESGFFSYYYLKGKNEPASLIASRPHLENIVIDSGAHTFFAENASRDDVVKEGKRLSASAHVKKTITKETPDEYFDAYVEWIIKYRQYFDYAVELDIGELVGQAKVNKWRERLKQVGVYDQIITVMHPAVMTWDDYIAMLDDSESGYVAMEGMRPGSSQIPYFKYIQAAMDRGVKVHGFALTKEKIMSKYPFYSVDSSSWKAGVQYGTYTKSVDGHRKMVNFRQDKWNHDFTVPNLVDAYHATLKTQRYKRLELSARSYQDMANYYTKVWQARGIDWEEIIKRFNKK